MTDSGEGGSLPSALQAVTYHCGRQGLLLGSPSEGPEFFTKGV